MLNVTKLSGGNAGAVVGYLQERQQLHNAHDGSQYMTGYYANQAPSEWSGELAAELGLSGEVDADTFERLLNGETPDGERFAKESAERRMGVDLTFNAPKSVSIEALANGNEQIKEMHEQAVQYALGYIESDVVSARYGKDGVRSEKTGNALFARFAHENARPVNGKTQPHLHDHVIALNVTRGSGGDLRALDLDFGSHSVRHYTATALYQSKYAELLESAGFEVRQTKDGFELAHISDAQIEQFSDRTAQIDENLESNGKSREDSTGAERSAANMRTRTEKATKPQEELIVEWHDQARQNGVSYGEDAAKDHRTIDFDNPDSRITAARAAVDKAIESHGERESVLSREQVVLEAVRNGIGQTSPEQIRDALENHESVYLVGNDQLVTQQALDREQAIMDAAASGRGQHDPIYSETNAQERIAQHEQQTGIEYSDGQRAALELALTSTDQTAAVVGAAGAGKTTAMATISSEAQAAGYHVVGLAPSTVASEALGEAGINDNHTLASWHLQERDPDGPARYIVVDESGMVDDHDMQQLMNGLRSQDRLLLVGDPRQLQPVEAGSSYSEMLRTGAVEYAQIDEIRRQNDPRLLEMTQAYARGDAETATGIAMEYATEVKPKSNSQGNITKRERREAIATETARTYLNLDSSTRDDTVVLSGTNDTRSQINDQIRNGLIAEGAVDTNNAQSVTTLNKTQLKKAQIEQARYYQPGHIVTMRERRETRQYTVDSVDTRANTVTMRDQSTGEARTENAKQIRKNGQLYDPGEIELGTGDRIIINENDKQRGIINGDTGRVTAVNDHGVNITLDRLDQGDPINVTVDPERGAALDYAYARTIHKAQGITEQNAIVAGESSTNDTAHMGYVATSREKDRLWVITDNTDRLQKSWQEYANEETATSAMQKAEQQRDGAAREQAREQEREQREDPGMRQHNSARELDDFKKWDLTAHLERDGFERDSKESSRGYDVMRRDDEKLIVTQKGQHQIYSDAHDSSNAGTIIDYEKNQHGRSLGETRQHLRELDGGTAAAATAERTDRERTRSPEKDTEAVAERYNNYDSYKHEDSYLERRGIDAETVDRFDVRQDERGNAVFRHRDVDENRTVGYELKNDEFNGFSAGGERSLAMEKIGDADDISRVVVTESTIDSMSYYQRHRDEIDAEEGATVFISTGGAAKTSQLDDIRDVVRRTGADEVRLAHDADASGDQMSARLRDHLTDTGAEIERDRPEQAKDWNDELQTEQRQEREREEARQAQAEQEKQAEQQKENTAENEAEAEQSQDEKQEQLEPERQTEQEQTPEQAQEQKQEYRPESSFDKPKKQQHEHEQEDDYGAEFSL